MVNCTTAMYRCTQITATSDYFHLLSVLLITCHQNSDHCFIRMLSINNSFYYSVLSHVINTFMNALLECHQYTLIVLLQCIAIICQSINPDCFWKPIKLLRTHPVDAKISDGSYRYLANCRIMYIEVQVHLHKVMNHYYMYSEFNRKLLYTYCITLYGYF